MLGSQAMNTGYSIAGYEIGVPEIQRFGFAHFPSAVATTDEWEAHDSAELVFMLEGEACWELDNHLLVPVNGGQFSLFPPKQQHRINNGIYPPCSFFWIAMSDASHHSSGILTGDSRLQFDRALGCYGLIQTITEQCMNSLQGCIRLIQNKRTYAGSALNISELRAHINLLLVEAWKAHEQGKSKPMPNTLISRVVSIVQRDQQNWPQIGEIAEELGCSRGRLHQVFRQHTGMSPSDYLQRMRIKKSCEVLVESDLSITEVAYELDYANSQHFSRTFRKYLGLAPSDYRDLQRKKAS